MEFSKNTQKPYPVVCDCGSLLVSAKPADRGRQIQHQEHLKRELRGLLT